VLYLAASLIGRNYLPAAVPVSEGDPPSLTYLSRFVSLVHLLTHGDRLFDEVLPGIHRRLSAISVRHEETRTLQARGPVSWPSTLRAAWERGGEQATELVSRRPGRDYATPANQLAALTLHMVERDVHRLTAELGSRLLPEEAAHLDRLAARVRRSFGVLALREAEGRLARELVRDPTGPAADHLATEVERWAGQEPRARDGYLRLVEWHRTWRRWLTGPSGDTLKAPLWECGDDDLYELVVLLELATAFSRRAAEAHQARTKGEHGRPTFDLILTHGRRLRIWFQSTTARKPYTEIRLEPDLVIDLDGCAVVCEAKSYSNRQGDPRRYTSALNELMSYLFTYGYPDRWHELCGGLGIFPFPAGSRHPGYRRLTTTRSGELWLGSLVIPFTGADPQCDQRLERFVDDMLAGRKPPE